MLSLSRESVGLAATPKDKQDAIQQVGAVLARAGYIDPAYVASMGKREEVANTFLGQGIAIPHGLPEASGYIKKTGVAVLQVPGGVSWGPGQTVHLVFGIAAASDEHLALLGRLTTLLDEPETVAQMRGAPDAETLVKTFAQSDPSTSAAPAREDLENRFQAKAPAPRGLHARPATMIAQLAQGYPEVELLVRAGDKSADGKRMSDILKLNASPDTPLVISAAGPRAVELLTELRGAFEDGFGEEEEAELPTDHGWAPKDAAEALSGVAASVGLGIGPTFRLKREKIVVKTHAEDPEAERRALKQARAEAAAELDKLYEEVSAKSGASHAAIFKVHAEFLADEDTLARADAYIAQGFSAGWGWRQAVQEASVALENLDDPVLASRAVDLRDVGKRVLRRLSGLSGAAEIRLPRPSVLLAADIDPSDTARLDKSRVLGICTEGGGPNSHAAIIARALDIPAVAGFGEALTAVADGTEVILDGSKGALYLKPSAADRAAAEAAQEELKEARNLAFSTRFLPALTRDGHRVQVAGNISSVDEAKASPEAGAEGIGLVRSEFLFLDRQEAPTEDEQYETYLGILKGLQGLPVVIRTLDVGGDKQLPYLKLDREDNPFLGVRGLRLCLAQPELFRTQLRALYRAAKEQPSLRILLPMVTTFEELAEAKRYIEEARAEVGGPECKLGIMVEVPTVVQMAAEFAREVDFFSIGTNDLTQYLMAIDRLHPKLSQLTDSLHPAVLRAVKQVVEAAHANNVSVAVCGGAAGDAQGAPILAGLGVDELSVSLPRAAVVKAALRGARFSALKRLAGRALRCRSAAEVRKLAGVR